jgi:hypothetical protein
MERMGIQADLRSYRCLRPDIPSGFDLREAESTCRNLARTCLSKNAWILRPCSHALAEPIIDSLRRHPSSRAAKACRPRSASVHLRCQRMAPPLLDGRALMRLTK